MTDVDGMRICAGLIVGERLHLPPQRQRTQSFARRPRPEDPGPPSTSTRKARGFGEQAVRIVEEAAPPDQATMDHIDRAVRDRDNRIALEKLASTKYDLFGREGLSHQQSKDRSAQRPHAQQRDKGPDGAW
jgi:hypothetical protein